MNYVIDLGILGEVEVDVTYKYYPGSPATRLDPPEGPDLEITKIMLEGTDVTKVLYDALMDSEDFFEYVAEIESERDAEDADHYYQEMKDRHYESQAHV